MKKIDWGLVGGGKDSQIGYTHRSSSSVDGRFRFVAGALDIDPVRAIEFALDLGIDQDRAYGSWQEMLDKEQSREDRVSLVTVATPNSTHHEISKAFLEAGFHVLCEKPLTLTVEEARDLVNVSRRTNRMCAVNYGYSGYPMVRQMKSMVSGGQIGHVRVVVAEFAGGFMADAADADNPRVRWRFDPEKAGVAAVSFDLGVHALFLACYVTGQKVTMVSSDFASGIAGRQLEDDALTAFRMSGGTIGRVWTSGLAIGRTHGLTLQVFGETGGLRWSHEQPNQLYWTPLNGFTRTLERGSVDLTIEATRASRIAVGHPEGFLLAFANIYRDLAEVISGVAGEFSVDELAQGLPMAADGLHSIETVHSMVESAQNGSRWVEVPGPQGKD